eukprot:gene9999-7883_t
MVLVVVPSPPTVAWAPSFTLATLSHYHDLQKESWAYLTGAALASNRGRRIGPGASGSARGFSEKRLVKDFVAACGVLDDDWMTGGKSDEGPNSGRGSSLEMMLGWFQADGALPSQEEASSIPMRPARRLHLPGFAMMPSKNPALLAPKPSPGAGAFQRPALDSNCSTSQRTAGSCSVAAIERVLPARAHDGLTAVDQNADLGHEP